MKIEILNDDWDSVGGYVMAPTSVTTSDDIDMHDQIVDYVNNYTESERPLGKVTINADEEISHCYNFNVAILSDAEARLVALEHHNDMLGDR